MKALDLSLYLVADADFYSGPSLVQAVAQAADNGVTLVQLRAKQKAPEELLPLARELVALLRPRGIPLVINDHVALVQSCGADGVHLGLSDESVASARSRLGSDAIIGLSIEPETVLADIDLSMVNYIAASPVFFSSTKPTFATSFGLKGLNRLRRESRLPVVAIGGIHEGNTTEILMAGAEGVAVISAILGSSDVAGATRTLRERIDTYRLNNPKPIRYPRRVLTIAGSDSGGGAGIQADLKTFEALDCFGMSAITALTAQNTLGVQSLFPVPTDFIVDQIQTVVEDIGVDAVKLGMLFSAPIIESVARCLGELKVAKVVVDPVMVAKGGSRLLKEDAVRALKECIFPIAGIVTPNIPEAEVLTGTLIQSRPDMERAALALMRHGPRVVIKGGHLQDGQTSPDFYADRDRREWIETNRVVTPNSHGTGCTYSAAIAAFAARGQDWFSALKSARAYLQGAILSAAEVRLGEGCGPLDRGWAHRNEIRSQEGVMQ